MEHETKRATQGLLEPVQLGSVTFAERILAPLSNSYLFKESKECFTYGSAQLIKNATLEKQYAAFRSEKREKGYSEQELEESFAFLLFDDANKARKVGETGLKVRQGRRTTIGDPSKGVYISKYSDCLGPKALCDGKTGYLVLFKLTQGRTKKVKSNYKKKVTPPTPGFDCHTSNLYSSAASSTSCSLAYERTQFFLYELDDQSREPKLCPRHVCPFAIVEFSYGKMSTSSQSEQTSQDKTVFQYQPWSGQFKIESIIYDVGLQSTNGACFPTKLPKTVKIDHAIGVSELKRALPQEVFETCIVGEVCIDGRCFNLYDVVSSKAKNDLAQIAQELKEKDMALVIPLEDSGFLILLHSSHLFSNEDAQLGKAAALQGMFIFPDSRSISRDSKPGLENSKLPAELIHVIPALNFAEKELKKSVQTTRDTSWASLEKRLHKYGTQDHKDSVFPDQHDVPGGFTLISPKWTKETGTRLKSYFDEPYGFTIPVGRALELLNTGVQQAGEDCEDICGFKSSPQEPEADSPIKVEVTRKPVKQKNENLTTELSPSTFPRRLRKLGTAYENITSTVSPKLVDVLAVNRAISDTRLEKTSQRKRKEDELSSKQTPIQSCSARIATTSGETGSAEDKETEDDSSGRKDDSKNKGNHRNLSRIKDQTETMPVDDVNLTQQPSKRGRMQEDLKLDVSDTRQDPSLKVPPEQSMKCDKASPSSQEWRSLPRNKRVWNPDDSLKRSLRSSYGKVESEHVEDTHHEATKQRLPSTTKRKVEGYSLRGLKTIITNCGRVFVPHGSDIDADCLIKRQSKMTQVEAVQKPKTPPVEDKLVEIGERKAHSRSLSIEKEDVPSADLPDLDKEVSVDSTSKEMPSALLTALRILKKHHQNSENPLCRNPVSDSSDLVNGFQQANKDSPSAFPADTTFSPPRNSDQSTKSDVPVVSSEKSKKKAKHMYSAISISKLKTVLKKGTSRTPPSSCENTKVEQDSGPELKKRKLSSIVEMMYDISKKVLTDDGSKNVNDEELPMKTLESAKQLMSPGRLGQRTEKENGSLTFNPSVPFEMTKQTNKHFISSLIAEKLARRTNGIDEKVSSETFYSSPPVPSDALSLLADLALGGRNDKMLSNPENKLGLKDLNVVKAGSSPESVLHALLRYPASRLKLPPRSFSPESLLATGEMILEISKEHSYSQSTSSSGVSGPSSPSGSGTELKDSMGSHDQVEGGKREWNHAASLKQSASFTKTKLKRFLRHRRITQNDGLIQVTRTWKEAYDFKFDSKFTNDSLDKTVTRALHGKWNFNIEDTFEDVHLIFHMWIGLFYSRSTSRLFQLENSTSLPKGKDIEKVRLDKNAIEDAVSSLNVELSPSQVASLPKHLAPDVLDLSARNEESLGLCLVSNQNRTRRAGLRRIAVPTDKYKMVERHAGTGPYTDAEVETLMKYRSAVDTQREDSVPDTDHETDDENDNTTDCSYSQLLEGNSAYFQLCEETSNMRIGVLRNNIIVANNKALSQVTPTDTDAKSSMLYTIIKPAEFSNPSQLILDNELFVLNTKLHESSVALQNVAEPERTECVETSIQKKSHVYESEEHKSILDEDSQNGCLRIIDDENELYESSDKELCISVECDKTTPITSEDPSNYESACSNKISFGATSLATEEQKSFLDDTKLFELDKISDISSDEMSTEDQTRIFKPVDDPTYSTSSQILEKSNSSVEELDGRISSEAHVDAEDISSHNTESERDKLSDAQDNEPVLDLNNSAIVGVELKESSIDGTFNEDEISSPEEMSDLKDSKLVNTALAKVEETMFTESTEQQQTATAEEEFLLVLNDDNNTLDMEICDRRSEKMPNASRRSSTHSLINDCSDVKWKDETRYETCNMYSYEDHPTSVGKANKTPTLNEYPSAEAITQQETLETCQDVSSQTVESFKLCIRDSDLPNDCIDVDNTLESSERSVLLEKESSFFSLKIDSSISKSMADPTLVKPLKVEHNSACSTPTQDEMSGDLEGNEQLRAEALERRLHFPENTVRVVQHAETVPPKSPESTQSSVSTIKQLSVSLDVYEEAASDESNQGRSKSPDEWEPASISDHSKTGEYFHKSFPCSREKDHYFSKGEFLNDSEFCYENDAGDWDEDHHGYDGILWREHQSEEQADQFYPYEKDSSFANDSPTCSKYLACESEISFVHKHDKNREMIEDFCWRNGRYRADPLSMKCPITVTCTAERNPKNKSRKRKIAQAFGQRMEWYDEESSRSFSSFETKHIIAHRPLNVGPFPAPSKHGFDWRRYFRREETLKQQLELYDKEDIFDVPPSSIVTILNQEGSRVTFSNSSTKNLSGLERCSNKELERSFNRWQEYQNKVDGTQSTIENEYLVFTNKINQVLKESKSGVTNISHESNSDQASCPLTLQFSSLSEVDSAVDLKQSQRSLINFKIKVDLSDREKMRDSMKNVQAGYQKLRLGKAHQGEFPGVSKITQQCAVSYKSMMKDVCSGKGRSQSDKSIKRNYNRENASRNSRICCRFKKNVFDSPHDGLKSTVRDASKKKYRFYIHKTSTDAFFEETKNLMEIEGHILVEPEKFNLENDGQLSLLIIMRNEDIAKHICQVPNLLELKKSPSVNFAGIDRPDDVVNLTHQELFAKGGFIVCDDLALDTLSLDDMKKIVEILEELGKQGKWKWFLHYRDSRTLRESARSSPELGKKQQFLEVCQRTGIVDVLPYHECDLISRDWPDYFVCLTRLQIQNVSVRFPVFITDTPSESFGTNGILTMNPHTFSRILSNENCSVS